jgi:hypothetical protein
MLREEQGDIIREVRKVGASAGVEVVLEDPGEAEARENLKEKIELLNTIQQRVWDLESTVSEVVAAKEKTAAMTNKSPEHPSYKIMSEREVEGMKEDSPKITSLQPNKRKRKSAQGIPAPGSPYLVIDLSRNTSQRPPSLPKHKQEIPNSQSPDEPELLVESESGEDEDDEDVRIKSPAERRRRAPPPARRARSVVLGHRPRK